MGHTPCGSHLDVSLIVGILGINTNRRQSGVVDRQSIGKGLPDLVARLAKAAIEPFINDFLVAWREAKAWCSGWKDLCALLEGIDIIHAEETETHVFFGVVLQEALELCIR